MKNNNLFIALHKYPTSANVRPEENYFTEAFAWVLKKYPELTICLLKELLGINLSKKHVVKTQVYYSESKSIFGQRSFIDLQIEDDQNLIFFENKISAQLNKYLDNSITISAACDLNLIDQIQKYQKIQASINDNRSHFVRAIEICNNCERKDIILWSQFYSFIYKWNSKHNKSEIADFLELMEIKSMSNFKGFKKEYFESIIENENNYYDKRAVKKIFTDFINAVNCELKEKSDKTWLEPKFYSKSVNGDIYAHFLYSNPSNLNITLTIDSTGMSINIWFPLWKKDGDDEEIKNSILIEKMKKDKEYFVNKFVQSLDKLSTTVDFTLGMKQYEINKGSNKNAQGMQKGLGTGIYTISCGSSQILNNKDTTLLEDSRKDVLDGIKKDEYTNFFNADNEMLCFLLDKTHKEIFAPGAKYFGGSKKFHFSITKSLPMIFVVNKNEAIVEVVVEIIKDFSNFINVLNSDMKNQQH